MISFYLDNYLEKGMLREVLLREKINQAVFMFGFIEMK